MRVHVFFGEVMDHVCGLGGSEERCAGAVTEEAEVAIVGDNVDWRVPSDLAGGSASRTNVVDGADVAAVEPEAMPVVEHVLVAWVLWTEGKRV